MLTMAIDFGLARIGIALSDEQGVFAFPIETYQRKTKKKDLDYLIDFCRERKVNRIVFGDPLHMDGSVSEMSQRVHSFAKDLDKKIRYTQALDWPVTICFFDERQTTQQAQDIIHFQQSPRRRKAQLVDQIAASLILKAFLKEEQKHGQP